MSLVAYGDSDDGSSDSEGEENTNVPPKTSSFSVGESSSSSEELAQEAAPSTSKASEEVPFINSGKRSRLSSLLPKPNNPENATTVVRSNFSNLDTQNFEEDEDEILEVEEEYVPLSQIKKDKKTPVRETNEEQKSVGSLFSRMPSPWSFGAGISLGKKNESSDGGGDKKKKGKQPVRIVAPTISQEDLDDDDEDDKGPAAKKPMKSKTGSGLSSLLPKPKHSITTTMFNPNKPAAKITNRPLIPHTLTKKPEPAKKDPKKVKKSEDDGSGDEEDGEPVSFFSFSEKKSETEQNATKNFEKVKSEASISVNILGDEKPMDVPTMYDKSETIMGRRDVGSTGYSTAESYGISGVESDSTSISYGGEGSSYGSTAAVSHYYDDSEGATTTYYQTAAEPSQHYPAYAAYDENAGYYQGDGTHGMYNQTYVGYTQEQPEQTDEIDMEKLKKLQGKRNRNEQINIIDINAADQTGDTQLQMTKITSEQIAHRPSKKKGNMPSSQQRRKHQITYLAFQAKEKEFELQQQWSSNRQTKRQTQAKYGF